MHPLMEISKKAQRISAKEAEMIGLLGENEDVQEYMRRERQVKESLQGDKENIKSEIKEVFQGVMPYDLRMYYIPVREASIAYNEGKYEIVNKYVEVIVTNFKQDVLSIKSLLHVFTDMELIPEIYVSFATDEEMHMPDSP